MLWNVVIYYHKEEEKGRYGDKRVRTSGAHEQAFPFPKRSEKPLLFTDNWIET